MFGHLPIPAVTASSSAFPHNVVFHTADWVNTEISEDAEGYDLVIAYVPIPCNSLYKLTLIDVIDSRYPNGYI